jgi:hypothetical protein
MGFYIYLVNNFSSAGRIYVMAFAAKISGSGFYQNILFLIIGMSSTRTVAYFA